MSPPLVSIVILSFKHPEVIDICLRTLAITEDVDYEVVVVDNGNHCPEELAAYRERGLITKVVPSPVNLFFSGGNNLGVASTDPASEYILLLNSDVAFLRPDWLRKQLAWMNGEAKHWPAVWGQKPTIPRDEPLDIVSIGWSHDANVIPSNARPEGWCCMFRRAAWRTMDEGLPWHGGFEKAVADAAHGGARIGVLFNYVTYLCHREGGSGKIEADTLVYTSSPDYGGWFAGVDVQTLDFTLGPDEHSSYLEW